MVSVPSAANKHAPLPEPHHLPGKAEAETAELLGGVPDHITRRADFAQARQRVLEALEPLRYHVTVYVALRTHQALSVASGVVDPLVTSTDIRFARQTIETDWTRWRTRLRDLRRIVERAAR